MFQVHVYKYFLGLMCGVVFLYSEGNWEKYVSQLYPQPIISPITRMHFV